MNLIKDRKKRDMAVAGKFQNRFGQMIIGKEKETGYLVVLFKSKSEAMIFIRSDQKKLKELK